MTASRRGFLRRTLGVTWTGASLLEQAVFRATQARAQSQAPQPKLFDLQKLAEGVYMAVAKPVTVLNCNAVIFEQSNDLLVVDTHSKPSAVNALVAQIRAEITKKPVRYIVNSHFHWDHSQGAAAYRGLPGRPDLIASDATRKLLSEKAAARLKESRDDAQASIAKYEAGLASAKSPEEKAYWTRSINETKAYVREMANYAPELPNITVDRDLTIHDRTHELHIAFKGRGHTAGDVVVYCPQKRVVAAGDLCHPFGPYIGDGYPREWPRTLAEISRLDVTQVAGGHGPVQPSKQLLGQMGSYIEELAAAVARGKQQGKAVERLQNELTPASFRSLQSGLGRQIGETLLKYTLVPPGSKPEALLAAAVRNNVLHTYQTIDKT